jgi:hypothetical protein
MPIATQPFHTVLSAGQTEPVAELIQPFSKFPVQVTGPTVWKAEDYRQNPELWQKTWSAEQISDLETAFEAFEKSGKPLTAISKVSLGVDEISSVETDDIVLQDTFPLSPDLTAFLQSIRESVVNGPGFTLIQGLPVESWPIFKSSAIYLAIGTIFGVTLSQNGKGHVLGHVKVSSQRKRALYALYARH